MERPYTGVGEGRWYAVSTLRHRERQAEANLVRQGFKVFAPLCRKTVRHARRLTTKHAAYFPGYLFIALDLERDRWRSVNGTIGVRSLVMAGESPSAAPIGLVEQLIEHTDASGLLNLRFALEAGAEVLLLSGPFATLIGRFEKLSADGRVRVLLDIMNGTIPVLVDRNDLTAVAA